MLEIIRGAGEQGFYSELIRRTQFLDKRQRDDVVEALVDFGQIGTAMRATATKPVMVLRVTGEMAKMKIQEKMQWRPISKYALRFNELAGRGTQKNSTRVCPRMRTRTGYQVHRI